MAVLEKHQRLTPTTQLCPWAPLVGQFYCTASPLWSRQIHLVWEYRIAASMTPPSSPWSCYASTWLESTSKRTCISRCPISDPQGVQRTSASCGPTSYHHPHQETDVHMAPCTPAHAARTQQTDEQRFPSCGPICGPARPST